MVAVGRTCQECGDGLDNLHLLLVRENATHDDVVQRLFSVESEALSNGFDALGSEVPFGIEVDDFALTTTHVKRELRCDAKRMRELGFACIREGEQDL